MLARRFGMRLEIVEVAVRINLADQAVLACVILDTGHGVSLPVGDTAPSAAADGKSGRASPHCRRAATATSKKPCASPCCAWFYYNRWPCQRCSIVRTVTPRCGDKPPENSRTLQDTQTPQAAGCDRHAGYTFPRVAAGALASATRGMMRRIRGIAGGRLGLRMSQPRPKLSGVNWLSRRPADTSQPTQPTPAHLSYPSG